MNQKVVMIGIAMTLILILVLAAILSSSSSLNTNVLLSGFSDMSNGGRFCMYYADWCPHCQSVKPEFKQFMSDGTVTVNGKKVQVEMIQPEKEPEKMNGESVDGYPTFLYTDAAGKVVTYNGPRNTEGWMQFLKTKVLS